MNIKKIKDERVLQLNSKIYSETYLIVLFLLAVSIFIKTYVMDMSILQCIAELSIIVISLIHIIVRSVLLSHDIVDNSKKGIKLTIVALIILSIAVSISIAIKNYSLYGDKYTGIFDYHFLAIIGIAFVSMAIFSSVIFAILYWLNKKGQQRLEKMLNKEDDSSC